MKVMVTIGIFTGVLNAVCNYQTKWIISNLGIVYLPSISRDTLTTLKVLIKTLGVAIHSSLQPRTSHHTLHLSLYPSPLYPQYWAWPLTLTEYMHILQLYLLSKWDENVNQHLTWFQYCPPVASEETLVQSDSSFFSFQSSGDKKKSEYIFFQIFKKSIQSC